MALAWVFIAIILIFALDDVREGRERRTGDPVKRAREDLSGN